MAAFHVPPINRSAWPEFLVRLATGFFFYGIFLPMTWVFALFGKPTALLTGMQKLARGPQGGIHAFANYTPAPADIFVCTFAKSGTNWMMQIALQTIFRGKCEYENIHDAVPWPEMAGDVLQLLPLEDDTIRRASPENRRVIKTHLAAQHVPFNSAAHYLVVIRDPCEIYVSSYHFGHGSYGPLMPDADVWFDHFFEPGFTFNFGSDWAEHTAGWWALRDEPNVCVLLFNEMKASLERSVDRVRETLQIDLGREELNEVIHRSTFTYMNSIEERFLHAPRETLSWGDRFRMIRSGRQGNSAELLDSRQQQKIDEHYMARLQALGSDFPYEKAFSRNPT